MMPTLTLANNFLKRAIQSAYSDYYRNKFGKKSKQHLKPSNRTHHGIMHAIGCATLVPQIDKLYREHVTDYPETIANISAAFECSEQDFITLVQTAAVFHDSGRQGDGVDRWDHQSSLALEAYLVSQGIPQNLAKLMQLLIQFKDDAAQFAIEVNRLPELGGLDAEYVRHLMNTADTLEVIRVRAVFGCEYLPIYSIERSKFYSYQEVHAKVHALIQATATNINNEHRDGYDKHTIIGINGEKTHIKHTRHNRDSKQHDAAYEQFIQSMIEQDKDEDAAFEAPIKLDLRVSELNEAFNAALESLGKKIAQLRQQLNRVVPEEENQGAHQLILAYNANELQKKYVVASYVHDKLIAYRDAYISDPAATLGDFQNNCRALLDQDGKIAIQTAQAEGAELEEKEYSINDTLGPHRIAWSFKQLIESILKSLEMGSGLSLGSRFFKPESARTLDIIKDSVDQLNNPP